MKNATLVRKGSKMIRMECDSCEKLLGDDEACYTLSLKGTKEDSVVRPLHMDLCPRCARKYLKAIQEPLNV